MKNGLKQHQEFVEFISENLLPESQALSDHKNKLEQRLEGNLENGTSSNDEMVKLELDYQGLLSDIQAMKESSTKKTKISLDTIIVEVQRRFPNCSSDKVLRHIRDIQLQNNGTFKGLTIRKILKVIERNMECVICFEAINSEENLAKLTCNHEFHKDCIERWLKDRQQCPMCRRHIVPEEEFPRLK